MRVGCGRERLALLAGDPAIIAIMEKVVGGFAVIAHGGARTTKDIDLLIDPAPENVARVRDALQVLEDKAVNDVRDDDVARYSVVRVADEVVVDLLHNGRRWSESLARIEE